MSTNSVNLEERILPTAVGFQAMTGTETKSCMGVQLYLYEPETNTEGNANITVLFYEITERVVLRSENLQTIREYKSLKKPEFSQMQQRNQTRSL